MYHVGIQEKVLRPAMNVTTLVTTATAVTQHL